MFTKWLWMAFASITFQGWKGCGVAASLLRSPHLGRKQQHGSLQKNLQKGQPGPFSSCCPRIKAQVGRGAASPHYLSSLAQGGGMALA